MNQTTSFSPLLGQRRRREVQLEASLTKHFCCIEVKLSLSFLFLNKPKFIQYYTLFVFYQTQFLHFRLFKPIKEEYRSSLWGITLMHFFSECSVLTPISEKREGRIFFCKKPKLRFLSSNNSSWRWVFFTHIYHFSIKLGSFFIKREGKM